ncbi:hypothetical protein NLX67_14000 [Domibacillus sp. A3M-37]|uniref:hypothetical protein n=1 Tax=Domibacillus sp. A3M-37 TaxID=2962037 RepID=UPI0020B8E8AA|nr:hypothetical protein [Domibacillus sp. A3M-37]MCP3763494.1 hypothetical protein [Domibacillus sp. A3M-37]
MGFFNGTKEIDVKQKMLSYIKDLEQTKQQETDAMARLVKGLKMILLFNKISPKSN